MLLYIMKILKNLLGDQSKMHGDSVYLEHGSNNDGYWVKLPDDTVLMWNSNINLIYDSGWRLYRVWNYPAPLKEVHLVGHVIQGAGNKAPTDDELGVPYITSRTTTSAILRQPRIKGMTDFNSGNSIPTTAYAIGR